MVREEIDWSTGDIRVMMSFDQLAKLKRDMLPLWNGSEIEIGWLEKRLTGQLVIYES